jgi:hypothetical protein
MPSPCSIGKPPRRAAWTGIAVALLCLGLAGCSVVKGTITTLQALNDAGFTNANVSQGAGDSVEVRVRRDDADLPGAARRAAEIVWHKFPLRIDHLTVVCENGFGGRGTFAADREELIGAFGARDPVLDKGVQEAELRNIGLIVLAIAAVGVLILVAIVIGIVLLVRRNKRPPTPYHQTS